MTDEIKPAQNVFMWTRLYVLFSVNQIIVRELVPFEKWYQEAVVDKHIFASFSGEPGGIGHISLEAHRT